MAKKANPAVIGAFVVGAIALVLLGIAVLGSGRLFRETVKFVLFFPGSVNGLNVGAPVKFKGVAIGTVTDIRLAINEQAPNEFRIPVFIELDPKRITSIGRGVELNRRTVKEFIKQGLRAQLQAESFVTGVLFVELNVQPDTPVHLDLPANSRYMEIPTLPTTLEQATTAAKEILAKLEEIDFKKLISGLEETVAGINKLVNSPAVAETINSLNEAVKGVDEAAASIRNLANSTSKEIGPVVDSLKSASKEAGATLAKAQATFQSVETLVEPNSPVIYQLGNALQEVAAAARAVRSLADYLERNPSALLYGKEQPKDSK